MGNPKSRHYAPDVSKALKDTGAKDEKEEKKKNKGDDKKKGRGSAQKKRKSKGKNKAKGKGRGKGGRGKKRPRGEGDEEELGEEDMLDSDEGANDGEDRDTRATCDLEVA